MSELSTDLRNQFLEQIKELESLLTGNMMEDMDIKGQIHNIKMKLEGVKPANSFIDCIGCGS